MIVFDTVSWNKDILKRLPLLCKDLRCFSADYDLWLMFPRFHITNKNIASQIACESISAGDQLCLYFMCSLIASFSFIWLSLNY